MPFDSTRNGNENICIAVQSQQSLLFFGFINVVEIEDILFRLIC